MEDILIEMAKLSAKVELIGSRLDMRAKLTDEQRTICLHIINSKYDNLSDLVSDIQVYHSCFNMENRWN